MTINNSGVLKTTKRAKIDNKECDNQSITYMIYTKK